MTSRQRLSVLIFPIIAAIASYLGFRLYNHFYPSHTGNTPSINILFSTPLHQMNQKQTTLQPWKNKILVINFWATWCTPCRKEIPELIQLNQKWHNQNVEFIGIAIDFPEDVRTFMKSTPITYPIFFAPNEGSQLMQLLGNTQGVLPFTAIVDPQSHSIENIIGIVTPADVSKRLYQLIRSHN